jgi:hypothetical protein
LMRWGAEDISPARRLVSASVLASALVRGCSSTGASHVNPDSAPDEAALKLHNRLC